MPVLAPLRLALPARRPRSPAPPHTLASASLHSDSNGGRQPQLASPLAGASPRDSRRRAGVRRWVPPRPLPPPPRRTSGPRGALCAESSRPRAGPGRGLRGGGKLVGAALRGLRGGRSALRASCVLSSCLLFHPTGSRSTCGVRELVQRAGTHGQPRRAAVTARAWPGPQGLQVRRRPAAPTWWERCKGTGGISEGNRRVEFGHETVMVWRRRKDGRNPIAINMKDCLSNKLISCQHASSLFSRFIRTRWVQPAAAALPCTWELPARIEPPSRPRRWPALTAWDGSSTCTVI